MNPKNQHIIDEFERLIKQIEYDIDHSTTKKEEISNMFRLKSIKTAIKILKQYKDEIKTGKQLVDINNHSEHTDCPWHITVTAHTVEGYTDMDNFDMREFFENIGVDENIVNWGLIS